MSKSLSNNSTNVQANDAQQAWMRAAEAGDVARLQSLLKAGAQINFASESGETALMRAAARGYADVVEFLLDEGAEVNAQRDDGFNALIVAVFFGQEDVVRALLSRGADTSAQTRLGTTAEKWATARGFAEIIELLKAAEAERGHASKDTQHADNVTKSFGTIHQSETLPVESVSEETKAAGKIGESTAELLTRRLQSLMHEPDALVSMSMSVPAPSVGLTISETSPESEASRAPSTPKIKSLPRPKSSSQRFREAIVSWPVTMIALPLVLISGGIVGYAVWQRTKAHANASQPAPQLTTQTVEQNGAAQQQPALPVAAPPVLNADAQPTPLLMPQGVNGVPLSDVNVVPPPGYVMPATDTSVRPYTSIPPNTTVLPSTPALISESSDQPTDVDSPARREAQAGGQREKPSSSGAAKGDGSQAAGGQPNLSSSRNEKQDRVAISPAPLNAGVTQPVSALPQPTPKKRVIQWP